MKILNKNKNNIPFLRKISKSLLSIGMILTVAMMSCSKNDDDNPVSNLTLGDVSVFAGSQDGEPGYTDGTGSESQFYDLFGLTVDNQGNVYVADRANNKIRKITANATVSTIAGSTEGFADGDGANAQFDFPTGVAVDSQGNIYVADVNNHKIRKITPIGLNQIIKITSSGDVSTLAGGEEGESGDIDGIGTEARFREPFGVAVDNQGNLYVADSDNYKIKKITPNGVVTTLIGEDNIDIGFPWGITLDTQNNTVYVADRELHRIIKITQK